MIFQTIDKNSFCKKIYYNNSIIDFSPNLNLTHTWNYHEYLQELDNIEYAYLYCLRSLEQVCPEIYLKELNENKEKMKSIYRSLKESKVEDDVCLYEVVPERFIKNLCEIQNKITQYVFDNYKKPKMYEQNFKLLKLIKEISNRELNVSNENKYIKYGMYRTKTGRLKTLKKSFPILNLKKNDRKQIKPTNDYFIEMDINAAEIRTLLGLMKEQQPEIDIHQYHIEKFNLNIERDEMKKRFFSWIYNLERKDDFLDKIYDRKKILKQFYDNGEIVTVNGRKIKCDNYHAINYLLQSNQSEVFFEQSVKVHEYIKKNNIKKSFICFLIHDNIVLDVVKEEKIETIKEILNIFSNTRFGKYMISVKVGKNFGDMKKCII